MSSAPCTRDSIGDTVKEAFTFSKGAEGFEHQFYWELSQLTSDWLKARDLNPNATWEGAKIMGIRVFRDPTVPDGELILVSREDPSWRRVLVVTAPAVKS